MKLIPVNAARHHRTARQHSTTTEGNMTIRKRVPALLVTTALMIGGAAAMSPSAHATAAQGYMSGTGDVFDDWADEGVVSRTSHASSNATAVWQWVLYADGYLSRKDIDCQFGPTTEKATKKWQKEVAGFTGKEADGKAGKKTLGVADDGLEDVPGHEVRFNGFERKVFFQRIGGKYYVKDAGAWKAASYTSASAC